MKITTVVDLETADPNTVGELLRDKFWYSDPKAGVLGCYSIFDYNPDVVDHGAAMSEWDDYVIEHYAEWNGIKCMWYWDGDGYLEFTLPSGRRVYNPVCKRVGATWREDSNNG